MSSPVQPRNVRDSTSQDLGQGVSDAVVMRVGRVTGYDARNITIAINGTDTLVNAAYLDSYQPVLGDIVAVLKNGASWVVLGATSRSLDTTNVVVNPSFEGDAQGAMAASWGWYHDPASSTDSTSVQVSGNNGVQPYDGRQSLTVFVSHSVAAGVRTSIDQLYSAPFSVKEGETWAAAARFLFDAGPSLSFIPAQGQQLSVFIAWFAGNADVPPNQLDQTFANNVTNLDSTGTSWSLLPAYAPQQGNQVPAGAHFGRVVLSSRVNIQSNNNVTGTVMWDSVVARKIRNADGTVFTG